jgi:hypothetical protein
VALERIGNLVEISKSSPLTEQQAKKLSQLVLEIAPIYGTMESIAQLKTGKSTLTGEDASQFWAAIGVLPIAGGVIRKVGEPVAKGIVEAAKVIGAEGSTLVKEGEKVISKIGDDVARGELFRGGDSLAARLGVDVKPAADGLIHPLSNSGKPQGLSLNLNPKDPFIQQYGGAFPVNSLPEGLQALPSGRPGHFVIAPVTPMTFEKYQQLLNKIQLGNFNVLP